MEGKLNRLLSSSAIVVLGLVTASCSTGPAPPKPGTPAFHWAAAQETYRRGDYLRANENLGRLVSTDNEYTARALPWRLVICSGLAKGLMDMAEGYDDGGHKNRANPGPFRKYASECRGSANTVALQLAETFRAFLDKSKTPTVPLDFDYPAGSPSEPQELQRLTSGILLQESELELIQRALLQRGVVLSACRAVGAPNDAPKALEIFQKGGVQVASDVFLLGMANSVYEVSQLYSRDQLDQPRRLQVLCHQVLEALKNVPASKQTKELTTKVQSTLKKHRLT